MFKPGDKVSGLTIVMVIETASHLSDTVYGIRYHCCGKYAHVKHRRVLERRRRSSEQCLKCSQLSKLQNARKKNHTKKIESEDYGITPPTWAVPASAKQYEGKYIPGITKF